jgi:hypothetical protein
MCVKMMTTIGQDLNLAPSAYEARVIQLIFKNNVWIIILIRKRHVG